MAKEWAKSFYNSQQWKDTRDSYFKYKEGLCERCLSNNKISVAEIIHHKEYITPRNINDINITFNWNNLMAVCRSCHNILHGNKDSIKEGLIFNEDGDIEYEA